MRECGNAFPAHLCPLEVTHARAQGLAGGIPELSLAKGPFSSLKGEKKNSHFVSECSSDMVRLPKKKKKHLVLLLSAVV